MVDDLWIDVQSQPSLESKVEVLESKTATTESTNKRATSHTTSQAKKVTQPSPTKKHATSQEKKATQPSPTKKYATSQAKNATQEITQNKHSPPTVPTSTPPPTNHTNHTSSTTNNSCTASCYTHHHTPRRRGELPPSLFSQAPTSAERVDRRDSTDSTDSSAAVERLTDHAHTHSERAPETFFSDIGSKLLQDQRVPILVVFFLALFSSLLMKVSC